MQKIVVFQHLEVLPPPSAHVVGWGGLGYRVEVLVALYIVARLLHNFRLTVWVIKNEGEPNLVTI